MSSEEIQGMEVADIIMDAMKEVLRERLGDRAVAKMDCRAVRKRVSKKVFEYLFHELLATGKVRLPPGLGTLQVVGVRRKVAKVFREFL